MAAAVQSTNAVIVPSAGPSITVVDLGLSKTPPINDTHRKDIEKPRGALEAKSHASPTTTILSSERPNQYLNNSKVMGRFGASRSCDAGFPIKREESPPAAQVVALGNTTVATSSDFEKIALLFGETIKVTTSCVPIRAPSITDVDLGLSKPQEMNTANRDDMNRLIERLQTTTATASFSAKSVEVAHKTSFLRPGHSSCAARSEVSQSLVILTILCTNTIPNLHTHRHTHHIV